MGVLRWILKIEVQRLEDMVLIKLKDSTFSRRNSLGSLKLYSLPRRRHNKQECEHESKECEHVLKMPTDTSLRGSY